MSCLNCKIKDAKFDDLFCLDCFKNFRSKLFNRSSSVYIEGIELVSFGIYDGALSTLVKTTKLQPFGSIPKQIQNLTKNLCEHWKHQILPVDYVIHVPGQPFRCLFESDFSECIASNVAEVIRAPLMKNCLKRHWFSKQQKNLPLNERLQSFSKAPFLLKTLIIKISSKIVKFFW